MVYMTLRYAKVCVDFQVDGIGRNYVVISEITDDGNHGEWLSNNSLLDYISDKVVSKGGASLAALACSLYPIDFQLGDWVSEETWLQVNKETVREVSLAYQESKRLEVIHSICEWVINKISDPDWWRTPWKIKAMLETFYDPPEDWWLVEGGHLLTTKQYKNCFKVAFATHLKTMSPIKRVWAKANLPIEFLL